MQAVTRFLQWVHITVDQLKQHCLGSRFLVHLQSETWLASTTSRECALYIATFSVHHG